MTSFVENFEKLSDLQKQGLEPARNFAAFAVDACEKLVRHNFTVAGDVLDYAVAQARLPLEVTEPKRLIDAQVAATKTFAERLTERANEYIELGTSLRDSSAALVEKHYAKPAKKPAKSRVRKAA